MDKKEQKQLISATIVFLMILSLGVLSWGYYNYRQAQNIISPERIISFSAEGKVLAKPDIAKIIFNKIFKGIMTLHFNNINIVHSRPTNFICIKRETTRFNNIKFYTHASSKPNKRSYVPRDVWLI